VTICWLRLCQIDLHRPRFTAVHLLCTAKVHRTFSCLRSPCPSAMVLLFQNGALPLRFDFASLAYIVTFLRRGLITVCLFSLVGVEFIAQRAAADAEDVRCFRTVVFLALEGFQDEPLL
jgi:hypothetical protein